MKYTEAFTNWAQKNGTLGIPHLGSSQVVAQRAVNLHKGFTLWNFENFNRVTGVTRKELVGETLWEVRNPVGEWPLSQYTQKHPSFEACWSLFGEVGGDI